MQKAFFCMIGKGDVPIFETQLTATTSKVQKDDLIQFIIHSALDSVEQKVWTTTNMFLKNVDKFNDINISAFCTAGHIKLVLLHDQRTDENSIKSFFNEVYQLYVKIAMNPFYEKNTPIESSTFHLRVKNLGDKYLSR